MRTEVFTLRSGIILKVSTAPFELAISLIEACKKATLGMSKDTPEGVVDQQLFASPEVRKALYPVFDTVLYDVARVTPMLFDDPKLGQQARGDYYEICMRVIEVTTKDFFLKTSSPSTTIPPPESKSPGSP